MLFLYQSLQTWYLCTDLHTLVFTLFPTPTLEPNVRLQASLVPLQSQRLLVLYSQTTSSPGSPLKRQKSTSPLLSLALHILTSTVFESSDLPFLY